MIVTVLFDFVQYDSLVLGDLDERCVPMCNENEKWSERACGLSETCQALSTEETCKNFQPGCACQVPFYI